jgi:hypothetical protein
MKTVRSLVAAVVIALALTSPALLTGTAHADDGIIHSDVIATPTPAGAQAGEQAAPSATASGTTDSSSSVTATAAEVVLQLARTTLALF